MFHGMARHELGSSHELWAGRLPDLLILNEKEFATLWSLHPQEYHKIRAPHGALVATPRWQQAYGKDYAYSKSVNRALPVETLTTAVPKIEEIVSWSREQIDGRLNGLLLNWYDGALGHYMGKHRDSTKNIIDGTPIVTISLGERRRFRLRPHKGQGFIDFDATNGTVFVTPYETNLAWTYEVPKERSCRGRRISITLRAFH